MSNALYSTPGAMPPYSQEAEEAVLGAILIDPDSIHIVRETFKDCGDAVAFYIIRNQYMFEAMCAVVDRGDALDYLTLQDQLRASNRLNDIGGPAYITHLINAVPTSVHVQVYARLVQRAAIRRMMLIAADEIKALALDEESAIEVVTLDAEERLRRATRGSLSFRNVHVGGLLQDYMDTYEKIIEGDYKPGIPTFLPGLSLYRGEVAMFVAPSGMGKTTVLTSTALPMARNKTRVLLMVKEMTADEMLHRLISSEIGIPEGRIKAGDIDAKREYPLMLRAMGSIAKLPLFMVDGLEMSPFSPAVVERHIARVQSMYGLDVVLLDSLSLMQRDVQRGRQNDNNRGQELHEIMMALCQIAKERHIGIGITHHLNRDASGRRDKRPVISDLDFGGDKDAHAIYGLYRENYYSPDEGDSQTELATMKMRQGDTSRRWYLDFRFTHSQYVAKGR